MKRFLRLVLPALILLVIGAIPADAGLTAQNPGPLTGNWLLIMKSKEYSADGTLIFAETFSDTVFITDSSTTSPSELSMTSNLFFPPPLVGTRNGKEFILIGQEDNFFMRGRIKIGDNGYAVSFKGIGGGERPAGGIIDIWIKAKRY